MLIVILPNFTAILEVIRRRGSVSNLVDERAETALFAARAYRHNVVALLASRVVVEVAIQCWTVPSVGVRLDVGVVKLRWVQHHIQDALLRLDQRLVRRDDACGRVFGRRVVLQEARAVLLDHRHFALRQHLSGHVKMRADGMRIARAFSLQRETTRTCIVHAPKVLRVVRPFVDQEPTTALSFVLLQVRGEAREVGGGWNR
jgi:hypothetical protein